MQLSKQCDKDVKLSKQKKTQKERKERKNGKKERTDKKKILRIRTPYLKSPSTTKGNNQTL